MNTSCTVSTVVTKKLCTGCGTCSGICPTDCIKMEIDCYGTYIPVINEKECINCGKCLKVCPGHDFNYMHYNNKIYNTIPKDVAIGNYIEAFAGRTTDDNILNISQSGGFVSSALLFCLSEKIIDGAVVTKWSEEDPFKPEVNIAKNEKDILECVGSKYNPVPVGKIIREILKIEGSYAVVGTSCQIQGMRKAEEEFPQLKERIVLYIGLHCLKVFNYHYHDQILYKIKRKKEDIKSFRFRDKAWRGWPCDIRLKTNNEEIINVKGSYRIMAKSYFGCWRCKLCFDKFNEFSDISCGDCRIPEHYGENKISDVYYKKKGKSDIVVRTKRAKNIIDKMMKRNLLELELSNREDLVKSVAVAEKKLGLNDYKCFTKMIKGDFPKYGVSFMTTKRNKLSFKLLKPYSIIMCGHYYFCHNLIRYNWFRFFLKIIPHKFLGFYNRLKDKLMNHVRFRREIELFIKKQ